MKKLSFISAASLGLCTVFFAFAFASCSKDSQEPEQTENEETPEVKMVTVSFVANAPASSDAATTSTKSAVADDGTFAWESGDSVSVYVSGCSDSSNDKFYKFTTTDSGSSAKFTGSIPEDGTISGYAVYPYDASHSYDGSNLIVNIPSAVSSTKWGPLMFADLSASTVTFQHLASLVKVSYSNIPVGTDGFVLTSEDNNVSGLFSVDVTNNALTASSGNGTSVTYNFDATTETTSKDFYVAVPAGSHAIGVSLTASGSTVTNSAKTASSSSTYTVGKIKLLPNIVVPAFTELHVIGEAPEWTWTIDNTNGPMTNTTQVFTWPGALRGHKTFRFATEGGYEYSVCRTRL
ncbi:MAG: fimbrillin family protein, partial [Bacteroidales bacterium]|nr:fimbrillin family protein [Bacteroidales bacterium]